jgi:hypothetical protein
MATKKKTTTKKAAKPNAAKATKKDAPQSKAKKDAPKPKAKTDAPQAKDKKAKSAGGKQAKRLSQIDAAARVLAEAKEPMNCMAMVDAMQAKGYWASPGGKTPQQTLYASILRDIRKGKDARFVKADRGTFALAERKEARQ